MQKVPAHRMPLTIPPEKTGRGYPGKFKPEQIVAIAAFHGGDFHLTYHYRNDQKRELCGRLVKAGWLRRHKGTVDHGHLYTLRPRAWQWLEGTDDFNYNWKGKTDEENNPPQRSKEAERTGPHDQRPGLGKEQDRGDEHGHQARPGIRGKTIVLEWSHQLAT